MSSSRRKVKPPKLTPKPKTLVMEDNKVVAITKSSGRLKKETRISRAWPLKKSFVARKEGK